MKANIKRWTSLCLSAAVLCSAFVLADPGRLRAEENLDDLRAKQTQIESDLAAVKENLEGLSANSDELAARLGELKDEQKLKEADYEKLVKELELAKHNVGVALERHENAVEDVKQKQREYEDRITSLFRVRNKTTLEILLESESMDGFFANLRLLSYVASVDQDMLEHLKDAQATAEATKQQAEQTQRDYEEFAAKKQEQIKQVEAGIAITVGELGEVNDAIVSAQNEVTHLEAQQLTTTSEIESIMEEARLQAEAYARAEAERLAAEESARASREEAERSASIANSEAASRYAEQSAEASRSLEEAQATATTGDDGATDPVMTAVAPEETTTVATVDDSGDDGYGGSSIGRMIVPLASYQFISDDFGYRSDPATGQTRMHWGIDYAAPAGTPVRAAHSGVVVIAEAPLQGSVYGYAGDFGNYIGLRRDDGVVTLYAHLKYVGVSVGQTVSQGEVIGQVGSTGYSTGPHLHFQVKSPHSSAYGVSPWDYF